MRGSSSMYRHPPGRHRSALQSKRAYLSLEGGCFSRKAWLSTHPTENLSMRNSTRP